MQLDLRLPSRLSVCLPVCLSVRLTCQTMYKTGLYSIEGKDPRGLSVVDPASYGRRFLQFMEQHIQ